MSVEDIQKVNKLAQELLDQEIATSREEAVQKAQEMLNKDIVGDNIQIKETDGRQNVAAPGEDEDKLRNMIERTKEQMARQFESYKNVLIALEKEIRALKQQVAQLSARKPEAKPDPEEEPMKVEEKPQDPDTQTKSDSSQEEPMKVEKKEEKTEESHPKRGKYNPDDVSVEKMFYFGNK